MIKLKLLLEQIVKEVGELENIIPYEYKKFSNNEYSFKTEDGLTVDVGFSLYDKDDLKQLELEGDVYNMVFSLENDQSQHKKENYGYLMRVIKTVFDINMEFIKQHPQVKNITLFAGNKDKDKFLTQTDKQKSNLYLVTFLKNRSKIPGNWWYKEVKIDEGFKGILIYKK